MRRTIQEIGATIKEASVYPPIRNLAASIATRAAPKDFAGQLKAIYDDFVRRWRYVRDPARAELLTRSPEAIYKLVLGGDGVGVGEGLGAGDCDCATVALGAMLEAIGFPIRIATTADRFAPPGPLFGHVFIQAQVPTLGWVTIDPVLHPKKKFGQITNYSRIAYWDLNGRILGTNGNFLLRGTGENNMAAWAGGYGWTSPPINQWQDYGFSGIGDESEGMPEDWSTVGLKDWGAYVPMMGIIDGSQLNGLCAEVDLDIYDGQALARTPMLELGLDDYAYMQQTGMPYEGMLALGDNGEIYSYDGSLGFFKKLFRRIKKGVRKVGRRIKRGLKKVLKKTKFGRALLRFGSKLKAIAMKVVRPLVKFVGKYASKLAPIAAMIPGYGTAIAAGLAAAGKVAKLMQKYGVRTSGKKGSVRSLALKNPKLIGKFKSHLTQEAGAMRQLAKRNPRRFKAMLLAQKRKLSRA